MAVTMPFWARLEQYNEKHQKGRVQTQALVETDVAALQQADLLKRQVDLMEEADFAGL
jgi:predicted transcriptional regulator